MSQCTWQIISTAGPAGSTGYVGSQGAPGGNGYAYVAVATNTTMTANTKYIVNTDTTSVTLTLPATPAIGQEVGVKPNVWYQVKVRNEENSLLSDLQVVAHHGKKQH